MYPPTEIGEHVHHYFAHGFLAATAGLQVPFFLQKLITGKLLSVTVSYCQFTVSLLNEKVTESFFALSVTVSNY